MESSSTFQFTSTSIEDARGVLGRFYYPIDVGAPDGVDGFRLETRMIRLGPLTVGQLRFGGAVTLVAPEVDAYHVTLPVAGRMLAHQGRHQVIADASTAAVFCPGSSVYTLHSPGTVELDIKIDRAALEGELCTLLHRDVSGPINFPPVIATAGGAGLSWSRLVGLLPAEYDNPGGLLGQPLIAASLRQSVLSGLLLSAPHRYLDELTSPVPTGHPRAVRRAIDAIRDEPDRAFTVADLAMVARTSVRSLQEGFRRHVGLAPMAYLQQVRLERAHDDLRRHDADGATVAAVAHRWGFAHLGRFARAYRDRYGVAPSVTLRREP